MPETHLFFSQPVNRGRQAVGLSPLGASISPVLPQGSCAGARVRVRLHLSPVTISCTSAETVEPQCSPYQIYFSGGTALATKRTVNVTWETGLVRAAEVNIDCAPPEVPTASEEWSVSANRRISEFERMGRGWDDEGALTLSHATVRSARAVTRIVSSFLQAARIRTIPSIAPQSDGSIRLEWANGDRELFLTVLDGHVEAQRWRPLGSVQSLSYVQMRPEQISAELDWLAG